MKTNKQQFVVTVTTDGIPVGINVPSTTATVLVEVPESTEPNLTNIYDLADEAFRSRFNMRANNLWTKQEDISSIANPQLIQAAPDYSNENGNAWVLNKQA